MSEFEVEIGGIGPESAKTFYQTKHKYEILHDVLTQFGVKQQAKEKIVTRCKRWVGGINVVQLKNLLGRLDSGVKVNEISKVVEKYSIALEVENPGGGDLRWKILMEDVECFRPGALDYLDELEREIIRWIRDEIYEERRQERESKKLIELEKIVRVGKQKEKLKALKKLEELKYARELKEREKSARELKEREKKWAEREQRKWARKLKERKEKWAKKRARELKEREKKWAEREQRKQEWRMRKREPNVLGTVGPSAQKWHMSGVMIGYYPQEFYDIRPYIIARDEGLCPICDQLIVSPAVHHIDQNRFNNSPYNLITVCNFCHPHRGMHETLYRSRDAHLMVYLMVLAQRRQDGTF